MTLNIGSKGYALLRNPTPTRERPSLMKNGETLVLKVCCRRYPRRSTTR